VGGLSVPEQPPIPGYEPVRPLGLNSGVVYLARHSSSGALVVLKVWSKENASSARRQMTPLARLSHPNIIRVYGMGEFEASFFCAFEYIGRTLADRLRLEGPLPGVEAARLARSIGLALQYAREQGSIAEGLTANEIGLTDENVPKLFGFVSSETIQEHLTLFAPAWMPPEWVTSGVASADDSSQTYRLGALMYEMLTAMPPFTGDSMLSILKRVVDETPTPPSRLNARVCGRLDAACMQCLAKRPKARFASLGHLLDELESLKAT
jgi:serine/threonine protein kinase